MAVRSKSSRLFTERVGLRPTYRLPTPTYVVGSNPVHSAALRPPLPNPEYQGVTQGDPPPDRGATAEWPHGSPNG